MMKLFSIFTALFLVFAAHSFAQSAWELKKDENGILIYSRSVKESKYDELKAVFDLPGTYDQLRTILNDVNNYKTWVCNTAASHLVERKSETEMVYYSRVSAPWPVSNRDFYSDTRIWMDSANHQMRLSSRSINQFPPTGHIVRIAFLRSEWIITAPSPGTLHVEYTLSWDPGGNIPAFLANAVSTSGPLQSFSQLKRKMTLTAPPIATNK
jgi:START domain